MKTGTKKALYSIEFTLLFFGVPLFLFFDKNLIHPSSVLLPILLALILYFRKQKEFKSRDLIKLGISKKMWLQQALAMLFIGVFLLIYVLIFEPENLFNLPKENPAI